MRTKVADEADGADGADEAGFPPEGAAQHMAGHAAGQGPACPRARDEATAMGAEQLQSELVVLARRLAAGTFELLVLVGELDARGVWADSGALSCASWLAHRCDIELATARRQVQVARAMRRFPELDAAMAEGDVSYSKARILAGQLTDANVEALVEIARTTPSGRLGRAIAAWSQQHEDPDEIRRRQQQSRSLGWGTAADGMVDFHARLTPEDAAVVCAVIDTTLAHRRDVPAGTSLRQQRADALVAICTGDGDAGAPGTEIVVHVSEDGSTLADGTPLSDRAVTSMLPNAFISLLFHDAERYPIDASPRRRLPTRRQRRVVEARQHECGHPGCHATEFLQCDHVQSVRTGGATVVENLQLLCGPHNRAKSRHEDAPPDG